MREIKFRMFDTEEKQFMNNSRVIESRVSDLNKRGRFVYQQYTGLKDKNGKEIYEGDIVRYRERNLEESFGLSDGEPYLEKTREIKFWNQSFNVPQGFIKDLEVIGNKFEHPYLLKEE